VEDFCPGYVDDLTIVQHAGLGEVAHEAAEFRDGDLAPRDADNDPVRVVGMTRPRALIAELRRQICPAGLARRR
jgi:hypothetical protein